MFLLLGRGAIGLYQLNAATEVDVLRVSGGKRGGCGTGRGSNATGYIVAAHRIEVAAKVVGKVTWIGVEKGDKVKAGQVLVRLEDDEYRAQLEQAKGQLANLQAKLAELEHGSRPEEIAEARANLNSGQGGSGKRPGDAGPHQDSWCPGCDVETGAGRRASELR